ncbi:MAG: NERD domain-containing protein [Firmicutes bacterium]|jgi:hypothetical protein|nr:NERD domain-containing protein [Bacillota bacterium]
MAKILKSKKNNLKKKYRKYRRNSALGFFSLLGVPFYISRLGILPTFFVVLILMIIVSVSSRESKKLKSGLDGEMKSTKILEKLPDKYYILPNLQIMVDGSVCEMDHVIVGSNGIFIVESKNHKGIIVGNENDREFVQHKTGRNGGEYSKTFYSPIKQVNTHVYKLSQLLKKNGYRQWIVGAVLFTNEQANIRVRYKSTPVFSVNENSSKSIVDYIENYESKQRINKDERKLIAECIHRSRIG